MVTFFSPHDFEIVLIQKTDQGQEISAQTTVIFMSDKTVIEVDYVYYGILIFPNVST